MKKLILSLLLLLGASAHAVNLPQASSAVQGGGATGTGAVSGVICPLANISTCGVVMICGGMVPGTGFNYAGLYSQYSPTVSAATYQVPSGKSFYAIQMTYIDGSAADTVQLGYGTVPLASENTASAPTGSVTYGTAAGSSGIISAVANTYQTISLLGTSFPSLSYPYFRGNGTTNGHYICIQGIVK